MISPERAIEVLNRQLEATQKLYNLNPFSPEYRKWARDTEITVERIFGNRTRHIHELMAVFRATPIAALKSTSAPDHAYQQGLKQAEATLRSMIDEIKEYGLPSISGYESNSLDTVRRICNRFHGIARQLGHRHDGRPTLEVADEFDVQDLLHALLKLDFDDIRPEPSTPSYAGGCSRMDFLLKQEQIVIEVKRASQSIGAKEIGDQLIIDIDRYRIDSDCKRLVCFVYDPEGCIGNPQGLENDLSARATITSGV